MHRSVLTLAFGLLALAACGDSKLRRPIALPVTTYPANQDFTLTLEMARCRQSCEVIGERKCDVSINEDERRIEVSAEVELTFEDGVDCTGDCLGSPVLAHCEVSALDAGRWTVVSTEGRFERPIDLVSD